MKSLTALQSLVGRSRDLAASECKKWISSFEFLKSDSFELGFENLSLTVPPCISHLTGQQYGHDVFLGL